MRKFKERWNIQSDFQLAIIILVFSLNGSLAVYVAKPLLHFIGLNQECESKKDAPHLVSDEITTNSDNVNTVSINPTKDGKEMPTVLGLNKNEKMKSKNRRIQITFLNPPHHGKGRSATSYDE